MSAMSGLVACPSCGLHHPDAGLPRPADLRASGECEAAGAAAVARFYAPGPMWSRQFGVDAYACSHPEPSTPAGIQRTALCLMTLDLSLECGQPVGEGSAMHGEMMRSRPTIFTALEPPRGAEPRAHRPRAG